MTPPNEFNTQNSDHDEHLQPPISIDASKLSTEALIGVVEDYIVRSGTDYGNIETSHEVKINQVKKQIDKNEVKIVYDPNTESVTLLTAQEFKAAVKNTTSN